MLDRIQIDFIIGIDTIPVRHRSHHPLFSLPQHVLFLLLVRRRFGKTDLQIGATEILSKLKKQIMNIFFAPPHLPFSLKEEFRSTSIVTEKKLKMLTYPIVLNTFI